MTAAAKVKPTNIVGVDANVDRATGDLTGHDRWVHNVLSSWLGHLVFIAAGFVMPRLIHDQIGQMMLGIWDLSWSTVSYLSLANLGLGSAVNRYVARYRAVHDVDALRAAVSSVMALQLVGSLAVLAGAVGVAVALPLWIGHAVGPHVREAQWVVGLLGASLAIQMAFDVFRGVLTGCHRWDLHNSIHAGSYALTVAAMASVLLLGGGLIGLAWVYLAGAAAAEMVRARAAYRVCPELSISTRHACWSEGRRMLRFGTNTIVAGLPPFLLVQTTNIMLASALGAAALAVFSRPIALLRHVETFLNKFSYVLTPMAGSLQSRGEDQRIEELFLVASRYGVALALPVVLVLAVYGDMILRVWMGPEYARAGLVAVLAFGYFLPVAQSSGLRILVGLNLHGRMGWWGLGICVGSLIAGAVILRWIGWSEERAALLIVIPLTIAQGIIAPAVACRELGIAPLAYLRRVFAAPVFSGVLFGAILLGARVIFADNAFAAFFAGCGTGGLVLAGLYWRYIATDGVKDRVRRMFRRKRSG